MAIPMRDLAKVADVPEVAAAIEARDEALAAYREAAKAKMDADRLLDQRNDELEAAAARALEVWRQGEQ